ncbi:MAG: hypothetical protein R6U44_08880 [Archaeoglobaceae archaeon]
MEEKYLRYKKSKTNEQQTFDEFSNFLGKTALTTMAFAIIVSIAMATIFIVGVMLEVGILAVVSTPAGLLLAGIFFAIILKMAYAILVYGIQRRSVRYE